MNKGERSTRCLCSQDILDSVADGVFTVDEAFRITSYNRAAERITGFSREEAIGTPCHEIFQANICTGRCALRRTFETGENLVDVPVEIHRKDGAAVPISVSTAVLRDDEGNAVGGVESFRDLSEIQRLRRQVQEQSARNRQVGLDSSLAHLGNLLPDIAASEATVLITGASGTGKGLLAQTIHELSPRREGPFVKLSCAALPENLFEAELFGYEKGAFTDAKTRRPGRAESAEGGTLFLDEIDDIPKAIQVKLLRFIQEREYEPLGSSTAHRADVRIIAATHSDLRQKVAEGAFREDLFYRINVVSLELPPLKERKDDIPALVQRFIEKFNLAHRKNIQGAADETLQWLRGYDFPGNIRELENAIEHAFVLCKSGWIEPRHLPQRFGETYPDDEVGPLDGPGGEEARRIRAALRACGGSKSRAARSLGMHRSTLWRKLHRYGIDP